MADSILDIIFRTKKTGTGEKESVSGLDKLKDSFESLTGVSLTAAGAITMATAAVGATVKFASQAVSEWSAYAESVDKASMATGVGVEEMSRLIQLADDFRVSQEALTGAMRMAMQNGFQPTVENLAALSDEYLAISDQTERVNLLQGIFGRQWESMVPLLERGGAAIREANGAISDSLVVTDDAVEANREYIAAVDGLEDAWQGVKNELAQGVIPALTAMLNLLNDGFSRQDKLNKALADGTIQLKGYGQAAYGIAYAELYAAEQQERFNRHAHEANQYLLDEYDASQKASDGLKIVGDAAGGMEERYSAAGQAAREAAWASVDMANAANNLATAQGNLQRASDDLATAQENWKRGAGGQIAGMLEQTGLAGEGLYAALDVLDQVQGTNEGTTARQRDAMQKLVDEYKRTGDLDAFRLGLLAINDTFMPLDESVRKAKENIQGLLDMISDFEGVHTAILRVVREGSTGTSTGGGGSTPIPQNYDWEKYANMASGGPVNRGRMYLVGEEGPELLQITPGGRAAGRVIPNERLARGAGGVMIQQVVINNGMDFEELMWKINRRLGG